METTKLIGMTNWNCAVQYHIEAPHPIWFLIHAFEDHLLGTATTNGTYSPFSDWEFLNMTVFIERRK